MLHVFDADLLTSFYSFFLSNSSIGKVIFSKIYIFQLHSSVIIATAFLLIFCFIITIYTFFNVLEQSTSCHRVATRTQQWRLWKLCWGGWLFYNILVENNSILLYYCKRNTLYNDKITFVFYFTPIEPRQTFGQWSRVFPQIFHRHQCPVAWKVSN